MKKLSIALLLSLLFFVTPVLAGSGHSHGPTKEQVKISTEEVSKRALTMVESLAGEGKIDKTWVGLKESKVEQKIFSQRPEWVVSYHNKELDDASKQTLYLFFTLYGEYLAANYSGT